MTLRKIKSLMVLKGIRTVDVARKANRSRVTVSIVLTGKGVSRHIQQTVADMLGLPYDALWGRKTKKRAA